MRIEISEKQPLADKIRPQTLNEFVGQSHLLERIAAFANGPRLPSLLFFGPPGCGKSTLAMLMAKAANKKWIRVSAPEAGLTALRKHLQGAEVLILDEIHRFSKAQQDFFLPILESGDIVLLATTTENPSFSVTRQLLSRLHVLRFRGLTREELVRMARRGAKVLGCEWPDEVFDLLAGMCAGDGRALLNLVEHVSSLPQDKLSLDTLRQALPEVIIRGDREGDSHYELASALIKSIRGSDVDAALYYLACLLESGEDPRFICRRLVLSASEDVGLGDPQALPLAVACQQAVEFVGMPEGFIPLAETVVYLALAPKNNASYGAYLNALKEVRENGMQPVPLHLRNASTSLHKEWGYGRGYKYPHAFPGSWVDQEYLPHDLAKRGAQFYVPKNEGAEARMQTWLSTRKRAVKKS
ncbi:MAG TPA: replication-associated recombination protein A [Humidesulfovibrio sp.]|uniref:replication-associated recombination protein A n=1 Tax=Humidesulfovibrio sp. TaxID=2910988 RepID=UPI002CFB5DC7|nr:replication-associated recombination protein A [Humidesulfovibrio sp.]HWR05173.1 replication-associated recombination protein A [Humidesulfovibrio sp.]